MEMSDDRSSSSPGEAHSVSPVILVVSASPELVETLQQSVAARGGVVRYARQSDRALELFHAHRPELVVLDVVLDDGSGWSVLDAMREEQCGGPGPKVLVVTDYGDPANRLMGRLQGVIDYLIKPLAPETLKRSVLEALDLNAPS